MRNPLGRFLCWRGRHRWEDAAGVLSFQWRRPDMDHWEMNTQRGVPYRRCARCGGAWVAPLNVALPPEALPSSDQPTVYVDGVMLTPENLT